MNKQELNAAFSCVKASDDLIREILAIEKEKKIAPRKILRRVAACAAVLALFFGVLVFKIPFPLLNIPVYARTLNDKELNVSFFVPKYEAPSHEVKPEDKYLISSFNSDQNASLYSGPTFSMSLHLNEKTTEYDQLLIFLDGKVIKPSFDSCMWLYITNPDGTKGRLFTVVVEKETRVDIILHDNETVSILQQISMLIAPTEGGWIVTMNESEMHLLESRELEIIG